MEIQYGAVHPQPDRSELYKAAQEWTQDRQDAGHTAIIICRAVWPRSAPHLLSFLMRFIYDFLIVIQRKF